MEKAEALAPQRPRGAATQPLVKTPTPGKSTCPEVAELLNVPLATTVKSLVLATDQLDERGEIAKTQVWLLLLRGDHDMNEIKVGKVPGLDSGYRFATVPEIVDHFGCQAGLPRARSDLQQAGQDRRRPRSRRHGRLDLRRERGGLPLHRRQLGPRPARTRRRGRPAQRRGGRPFARRQGPARDRARHRSRPRVLPGHQVQRADERDLPGRERQAAAHARWAATASASRGCPPPRSNRTTTSAASSGPTRSRHSPSSSARSAWTAAPRSRRRRRSSTTSCMAAGVDVMLDDRGERPGAMFADWELIGVPHRVVISDRGLQGRPARVPAPPRRGSDQGAGRRSVRLRQEPAGCVIVRWLLPRRGKVATGAVAAPAVHWRAWD